MTILFWSLVLLVAVELLWRLKKLIQTGEFPLAHPKADMAKPQAFTPHPYILYVKRPGLSGLYPTNGLGYAGSREHALVKPAGTVRLFFVGGSTAEEHVPDQGPDSSWPAKVHDLLSERFPGVRIECVNAATSGYTTAESLSEFLFRGLDLKPDILVVYHNVNDALTCQIVDGFRSDYSHARKVKSWAMPFVQRLPQVRFLFLYEYLRYLAIREFGFPNTVLDRIADLPWKSTEPFSQAAVAAFRRNIINLVNVAHVWNCKPVLLGWECPWETEGRFPWPHMVEGEIAEIGRRYFQYLRANNEALREVARAFPFCAFAEVGSFDERCFREDKVHFSAEGMLRMARRAADALQPVVRSVLESQGSE